MKLKTFSFKPFALWAMLLSLTLASNSFACRIEINPKLAVPVRERFYYVDDDGALKFTHIIVHRRYDKKTMPAGLLQVMRNLNGEASSIPSLHKEESAIFKPKN